MKREGFLYEKICDIENIKKAISKASLGKRNHRYVRPVLEDIDFYAQKVQQLLLTGKYIPSPYKIKIIQDRSSGKLREIYKPRFFPDQIVHWALILQIQPILSRGMYEYTCGSVPKRGHSYGQKRVESWVRNDFENTRYYLKVDIKKFYPSINNEIMKEKFRKIIRDKECLGLIDKIIDSETGLPIGNYTSQWFSNFFLQDFDHYIKEVLKAKYYVRYVDDIIIFDANKAKLHEIRRSISSYLGTINLSLKSSWTVRLFDKHPLDFLGLRFYRNKTILRRRTALRIRRRFKKIRKKSHTNRRDRAAIGSYWGWIRTGNNWSYCEKYCFHPVLDKIRRRKKHGKRSYFRTYTLFQSRKSVCCSTTSY